MKKLLVACSLGIALIMGFCSKADYNSGSGQTGYNPFADHTKPGELGTMTASINGLGIGASGVTAVKTGDGVTLYGVFGGENSTNPQAITLGLSSTAVGVYEMKDDGKTTGTYYKPLEFLTEHDDWGEVNVMVSDDTHFAGVFYFVTTHYKIETGTFNIAY